MSFHVEFVAKNPADAAAIIEQDTSIPAPMKAYLCAGISHLSEGAPVSVKAFGHLHSGLDHSETSATVKVFPLDWKAPHK